MVERDKEDVWDIVAEKNIRIIDLECRIAELRADNERLQHKADQYDSVVKALSVCDGGRYRNDTVESCVLALKARDAAEAENARLRALPLKDEVERVLEAFAAEANEWADDVPDGYHPGVTEPGHDQAHASAKFSLGHLRAARSLLSRLRAGEQEGWQQCGWAYQDKQWDEGRWHVCGMDSTPRERNGRLVQPIYVAVSPSVSEGGSRP